MFNSSTTGERVDQNYETLISLMQSQQLRGLVPPDIIEALKQEREHTAEMVKSVERSAQIVYFHNLN